MKIDIDPENKSATVTLTVDIRRAFLAMARLAAEEFDADKMKALFNDSVFQSIAQELALRRSASAMSANDRDARLVDVKNLMIDMAEKAVTIDSTDIIAKANTDAADDRAAKLKAEEDRAAALKAEEAKVESERLAALGVTVTEDK